MKKIYLVPVLILLSACASSSGVVKVGEDTYTVSGSGKSPSGYAGSEVMKAVFKEANDYCAEMSKKVNVVTTHMNDQSFGIPAAAEIQFKCLAANDPELKKEADKSPSSQSNKSSTTEKLKELESMRQQGLISDSEYTSKKKTILDAM
jgi:hypothetical protein